MVSRLSENKRFLPAKNTTEGVPSGEIRRRQK